VAIEFLSDDQVAAYGRFVGPPEHAELERFFFLDDADRVLIGKRRGDHNRLGFSLQLGPQEEIRAFIAARAWTRTEGPRALFDQSVAWLRERKILLPGPSGLARLVSDAPRELVYRAFTDPGQLAQWFGPSGCSVPRDSIEIDARPGGHLRFVMTAPDVRSPVHARFTDVVENELLAGERRPLACPAWPGRCACT
jgi:hypothetical protein